MTPTIAFKLAAGALALGALACGLMAARCSMAAARINPDPGWTPPGMPGPAEPGLLELQQAAWISATLSAMEVSGRHSRVAGRWTIAAVLLGATASIVGLFPL